MPSPWLGLHEHQGKHIGWNWWKDSLAQWKFDSSPTPSVGYCVRGGGGAPAPLRTLLRLHGLLRLLSVWQRKGSSQSQPTGTGRLAVWLVVGRFKWCDVRQPSGWDRYMATLPPVARQVPALSHEWCGGSRHKHRWSQAVSLTNMIYLPIYSISTCADGRKVGLCILHDIEHWACLGPAMLLPGLHCGQWTRSGPGPPSAFYWNGTLNIWDVWPLPVTPNIY